MIAHAIFFIIVLLFVILHILFLFRVPQSDLEVMRRSWRQTVQWAERKEEEGVLELGGGGRKERGREGWLTGRAGSWK